MGLFADPEGHKFSWPLRIVSGILGEVCVGNHLAGPLPSSPQSTTLAKKGKNRVVER